MSTYIHLNEKRIPIYDDICPLLEDFLKHIVVIEGKSLKTANIYYVIVRGFLKFVIMEREPSLSEDNWDNILIRDIPAEWIKEVTRTDISAYMYFLANRGNSLKTRKDKLTCLRSFFSYLVETQDFPENPALYVKLPKLPQRESKYLSRDEINMILCACARSTDPKRDYCITVLFLTCGLRLSELCSLNTDSFFGKRHVPRYRKGRQRAHGVSK